MPMSMYVWDSLSFMLTQLSLSAAVLVPARERRRCDELDCAMLDLFMFIFILDFRYLLCFTNFK